MCQSLMKRRRWQQLRWYVSRLGTEYGRYYQRECGLTDEHEEAHVRDAGAWKNADGALGSAAKGDVRSMMSPQTTVVWRK